MPAAVYLPERYISMEKSHLKKWKRFPSNMNMINNLTLADADGNPYKIYLTEATHTIRLEATLGGSGILLEELEDSIYRLNQIYRKLLVYTGATPDQYRDYNIDQVYPEVMEAMEIPESNASTRL